MSDAVKIEVLLDESQANELEIRAKKLHLFSEEYCGLILAEWVRSGIILEQEKVLMAVSQNY